MENIGLSFIYALMLITLVLLFIKRAKTVKERTLIIFLLVNICASMLISNTYNYAIKDRFFYVIEDSFLYKIIITICMFFLSMILSIYLKNEKVKKVLNIITVLGIIIIFIINVVSVYYFYDEPVPDGVNLENIGLSFIYALILITLVLLFVKRAKTGEERTLIIFLLINICASMLISKIYSYAIEDSFLYKTIATICMFFLSMILSIYLKDEKVKKMFNIITVFGVIIIFIINVVSVCYFYDKPALHSVNPQDYEITAFNTKFVQYEGNKTGVQVKDLLQEIISNNKDLRHKDKMIMVTFNGYWNGNKPELKNNKLENLNSIQDNKKYMVKFSYGCEGGRYSIDGVEKKQEAGWIYECIITSNR